MQQLQTHLGWFYSFRRLRLGASFAILLLIAVIGYTTIALIMQRTDTVLAQKTPTGITSMDSQDSTAQAETWVETAENTAANSTPKTPLSSDGDRSTHAGTTATAASTTTPSAAYYKLSISSIGLSSRLVTVGLTDTNAIDVHPSLVGRWNGSSEPGSLGAVFLDGHNPGVLSKLPNIVVGASITLTKANGEVFTYTVAHREIVQLAGINMRRALSVYGGATEGLNLMTCMGPINPKTGTPDQRLVVYAVRS